jgi:hypothetical protein
LIDAYKKIASIMTIVRVKNKLRDPLQLVHLNVNYRNELICEIQINIGLKPVNYNANHFLYELERADSIIQFQQQILIHITHLAETHRFYQKNIAIKDVQSRRKGYFDKMGYDYDAGKVTKR